MTEPSTTELSLPADEARTQRLPVIDAPRRLAAIALLLELRGVAEGPEELLEMVAELAGPVGDASKTPQGGVELLIATVRSVSARRASEKAVGR